MYYIAVTGQYVRVTLIESNSYIDNKKKNNANTRLLKSFFFPHMQGKIPYVECSLYFNYYIYMYNIL